MAGFKTKVSTKNIHYVEASDPRQIIEIVDGCTTLDEDTGELVYQAPHLILAGPKGGQFKMNFPEFVWEKVVDDVVVGDYFSGGWVNGKMVDVEIWELDEDEEDDED